MKTFNTWIRKQVKSVGWNNRAFCRAAGVGESVCNPSYNWCPKANTLIIMVETLVAKHIKKRNVTNEQETIQLFNELLWEAITSTKEYSSSITQLTKEVRDDQSISGR